MNKTVHTNVTVKPIGGTPRESPGTLTGAAVAARSEADAAAAALSAVEEATALANTPLTKEASVLERTAFTGCLVEGLWASSSMVGTRSCWTWALVIKVSMGDKKEDRDKIRQMRYLLAHGSAHDIAVQFADIHQNLQFVGRLRDADGRGGGRSSLSLDKLSLLSGPNWRP